MVRFCPFLFLLAVPIHGYIHTAKPKSQRKREQPHSRREEHEICLLGLHVLVVVQPIVYSSLFFVSEKIFKYFRLI